MKISELNGKVVNNIEVLKNDVKSKENNKMAIENSSLLQKDKVEKRNEKKAQELSKKEFKEIAEKLNGTIETVNEDLQFQFHEKSERMMAKLVNIKKHETIKEMPPKELLDMLGKIKKMVGLILNEKI